MIRIVKNIVLPFALVLALLLACTGTAYAVNTPAEETEAAEGAEEAEETDAEVALPEEVVELDERTVAVGESYELDISDVLEDAAPARVSTVQSIPILRVHDGNVTGVFAGRTRLSVLYDSQVVAVQDVYVTDAELPDMALEQDETGMVPIDKLVDAIGMHNRERISIQERGTGLLTIEGRSITAEKPGTALVDILLTGRRLASFLVTVNEPDKRPENVRTMNKITLAFAEPTGIENEEMQDSTFIARNETLVDLRGLTMTGKGMGETILYEIVDHSIVSTCALEVEPAQVEEPIEVYLGGHIDMDTLLDTLPPEIDARKVRFVAPDEEQPAVAFTDKTTINGLLPGSTQVTMMYAGSPAMEIDVQVMPTRLPAMTLNLGISTTIDPLMVPGTAGMSGKLTIKEDRAERDPATILINGLGVTAEKPGETTLLVYYGEELAATLPVDVRSTEMKPLQIELGTSLTLTNEDLPGHADGNKPTMEEVDDAGYLAIKGLRLTAEKPGKTKVNVLYDGDQAAQLDVDVTLPIFADLTLVQGERFEVPALPGNATLTEQGTGEYLSIKNQRITGEKVGETTVQVRYGDLMVGTFKVSITPAPVEEDATE